MCITVSWVHDLNMLRLNTGDEVGWQHTTACSKSSAPRWKNCRCTLREWNCSSSPTRCLPIEKQVPILLNVMGVTTYGSLLVSTNPKEKSMAEVVAGHFQPKRNVVLNVFSSIEETRTTVKAWLNLLLNCVA